MKATAGNIWKAASTDVARPVLTGVHFDAKNGTLTATDSYVMARVACEVEPGDESGCIPAKALKEAKGRSLKIAGGKATLTLADGERSWNLIVAAGKVPDFDKILSGAVPVKHPFGLNPELLHKLGSALTTDKLHPIVIHVVHPLRGARVTALGGEGVLMPVRVENPNGMPNVPKPIDLSDDDRVLAAARAAVAMMDKRRGKKRAAQAFREAIS